MSVGHSTKDFEKSFKTLIRAFDEAKIEYMIVGGLAANYYGVPRATFDFDLALEIGLEGANRITKLLKRIGFLIHSEDVEQMSKIGNRIMIKSRSHPYRVDLWLIKSDYDREAFERRKMGHLYGHTVWLISPEDLILAKIRAGRAKDIEDALGVLKVQEKRLNWSYLTDWAKRLNLSGELKRLRTTDYTDLR